MNYTKAQHYKLGDAIEIVDKNLISGSVDINNGERFIIVGVQQETPQSFGHITIIDNEGDDLPINESEFEGIKWIA